MSEESLLREVRLIVREETTLIVKAEVGKAVKVEVGRVVKEEVTKIVNAAVVMLTKRMDASDNSLLEMINGVDKRVTNLTKRIDALEKHMNERFDLIAVKLEELNNFKSSVNYRLQSVETTLNAKLVEPVTAKYKTLKEVVADYEARHKKSDDTDANANKESAEFLQSLETTSKL